MVRERREQTGGAGREGRAREAHFGEDTGKSDGLRDLRRSIGRRQSEQNAAGGRIKNVRHHVGIFPILHPLKERVIGYLPRTHYAISCQVEVVPLAFTN